MEHHLCFVFIPKLKCPNPGLGHELTGPNPGLAPGYRLGIYSWIIMINGTVGEGKSS